MCKSMKRIGVRRLLVIAGLPLICMLIGYLMITMVYLIPDERISANAKKSADILMEQGVYPHGFTNGWFLDNFTDADCISVSINKAGTNPFSNALNAFQMADKNDPHAASIEALHSTVYGLASHDRIGNHSYLWHVYRVWLRPMLLRYHITEIRDLLFMSLNILIMLLCIYIAKIRKDMLAAVPFLVAITFFNFQMESMSMLFFT